jgi:hypothetical protein
MDSAEVVKVKRHVSPSLKQIKALQLRSQGYSKRKAMIEAGYSIQTADHNANSLFKSRAAEQIIGALKSELLDEGLTTQLMAKKIKKWINAKKTDKDDYKTQQGAFRAWKDVMEPKSEEGHSGVKRRVTFEEFIGEPKNEGGL